MNKLNEVELGTRFDFLFIYLFLNYIYTLFYYICDVGDFVFICSSLV